MRPLLYTLILSPMLLFGARNFAQTATGTTGTLTYGVNTVTVAFWIRFPDAPGELQPILASGDSTTQANLWAFGVSATGLDTFLLGNIGTYRIETIAPLSAGNWHHVAAVFDNSTSAGEITVYLNGAVQSTTVISTKSGSGNFSPGTLRLGVITAGFSAFDGALSDIAIFSGALPAAQIASLAAGVAPNRIQPTPLYYWPLIVEDSPAICGGVPVSDNTTASATQPRIFR